MQYSSIAAKCQIILYNIKEPIPTTKGQGMLPAIEQLGPPLPEGHQRPTPELVEAYLRFLKEGLAPPSAPHLYRAAHPITDEAALRNGQVRRGVEMLQSYVDPRSRSALTAVGMAYAQLEQARHKNVRILAVNIGMPDLKPERALCALDGCPRCIPFRPVP